MNHFSAKDRQLFEVLRNYKHLNAPMLSELTGRSVRALNFRLLTLRKAGYLRSLPLPFSDTPINPGPLVHFLTQKGLDFAWKTFGIGDGKATGNDEKTNKNLEHELDLTNWHRALEKELPKHGCELLSWEQDAHVIRDGVEDGSIVPDAFIGIRHGDRPKGKDGAYLFVENERSKAGHYENGRSNLLRKFDAYEEYAAGGFRERWGINNFRVVVVLPSMERVKTLIETMKDDRHLNPERFWLTSRDQMDNSICDLIFLTRKTEVRSFLD